MPSKRSLSSPFSSSNSHDYDDMVLKTSPIPRGPAAKLPEGFGVLINGDPNTMSEAEWKEVRSMKSFTECSD